MRTFIAIELPEEIKQELANVQTQLKSANADVKWVHPQNIHLTIKFIGEIEEEKIDKINEALEEITGTFPDYKISLSAPGAFPNTTSPRVIWVGISLGIKETEKLAEKIEERLVTLGIPQEERAFSAHITLGRTRSSKNRLQFTQNLNRIISAGEVKKLEFWAGKIIIFKSELTSSGPIYSEIKGIPLKTP